MLRFFARTALLMIAFVVFLLLVRGIGAQGKNPLANVFTEVTLANGQKQVCWHGICPGQTTLIEAKAILDRFLSYYSAGSEEGRNMCWEAYEDTYSVCIYPNNDIVR